MEINYINCKLEDSRILRFFRIASLFLFSSLFFTRIMFLFVGECSSLLQLSVSILFFFFVRHLLLKNYNVQIQISNFILIISSVYSMSFFVESSRNLIWIILLALIASLFYHVKEIAFDRITSNVSLIISALFSIAVFLGFQLVHYGRLEILYLTSWEELKLNSLVLWVFKLFGLILFFYVFLFKIFSLVKDNCNEIKKEHTYNLKLIAAVPLIAGIFFVCWLPYLIAYFPGTYHPDSFGELDEVLGNDQIMNHHPFSHLMFIKMCMHIGDFFGSFAAGLATYSVLQMVVQAAVFAVVIVYLARKKLSPRLLFPLGIFFSLYMINGLYSTYMVKDVLFGCITLLVLIMLTEESLCNRYGKIRSKKSAVALIFIMFLFCISRNNGVYAFAFGFPLFSLCNREKIKRYLIVFATVLILVSGYKYIIYDVLGVVKGRTAEMLSVPLQQIARTMKLYEEELQSEEAEVLREVYPNIEELGSLYRTYISDPVKNVGVFESEVFDENPLRYAKCWLKLGLRHPRTYIDAMLLQCYGYFYPNLDVGGTIELSVLENRYDIQRNDMHGRFRSRIANTYVNYSSIQPTAILYSIGFAVWIIIASVGLFFVTGRAKLAAPCFILLGKWLTILLSPVFCEFRYVYCLVICAPVVLVMSLGLEPGRKKEH